VPGALQSLKLSGTDGETGCHKLGSGSLTFCATACRLRITIDWGCRFPHPFLNGTDAHSRAKNKKGDSRSLLLFF
jgi:hypothetical protein